MLPSLLMPPGVRAEMRDDVGKALPWRMELRATKAENATFDREDAIILGETERVRRS